MAGGMHGGVHAWWGMHSRGCVWLGGMHGGGIHGRGCACMHVGGVNGRRDGHCSRWYASYWNAFLFGIILSKTA